MEVEVADEPWVRRFKDGLGFALGSDIEADHFVVHLRLDAGVALPILWQAEGLVIAAHGEQLLEIDIGVVGDERLELQFVEAGLPVGGLFRVAAQCGILGFQRCELLQIGLAGRVLGAEFGGELLDRQAQGDGRRLG